MRPWWLVRCVACLALAVTACGGAGRQTGSGIPFGAEAVAWREARYAAGHACVSNLVRFFDENVVVDDRVTGQVIRGRAAFLDRCAAFAASHGSGGSDPTRPMALLLSADELIDQFDYPAHMYWSSERDHGVSVGSVGAHGYTRLTTLASLDHWRAQVPRVSGLDRLERLADRYLMLWNLTRGVDVARMYSAEASVDDTLRGLTVSGLEELRAAVGSGKWPDMSPLRLRAIYVGTDLAGGTDSADMVLLLDVADGPACHGEVGVALTVEDGRIARERRFHEVESVSRCLDTSTLQRGWWEGLEIPESVVRTRTGTVTWAEPSRRIEVFNGTVEMNAYVRWGLQRFADAALALPRVDSVTFELNHTTCPLSERGHVRYDESGADISLCFEPDHVCDGDDCSRWTSSARETLLHEYSHAWMAQNVTDATRQRFMRLNGVVHWDDVEETWGRRGRERATQIVTSGLMDEPVPLDLGECRAFAAEFRMLTGAAPLATCAPGR